jgi:hypothetical protein
MTEPPLRALSIRQPWCHAIVHGSKRIENRSWPPPSSVIGSVIALHAPARIDRDAWFPSAAAGEWKAPETLPHSVVLAVATVAACHDATHAEACSCSYWGMAHSWHWELADVRPLAEPVPCKGALSLWRLPKDVDAAVRAQLPAIAKSALGLEVTDA